jgi:hypothetical protein
VCKVVAGVPGRRVGDISPCHSPPPPSFSLAASLGSSFALARALDRIGVRLGLTDAVIGMLTALGADAPEISTAAAAC